MLVGGEIPAIGMRARANSGGGRADHELEASRAATAIGSCTCYYRDRDQFGSWVETAYKKAHPKRLDSAVDRHSPQRQLNERYRRFPAVGPLLSPVRGAVKSRG
jgi:hypothetical protein